MSSTDDTTGDGDAAVNDSEDQGGAVATEEAPAEDGPATEEAVPELDELRAGLVDQLRTELGDGVVAVHGRPDDDVWVRVSADAWVAAGEAARERLGCRYFSFLSAIDWLPSVWGRDEDAVEDRVTTGEERAERAPIEHGYAGGDTRFQVFARVVSLTRHVGLTLKVDVGDELGDTEPTLATWTGVYPGADWHEREAAEMYGITFVGHPHPTHIYLPTEFEGHPLRKDFPLLARQVKPWPGIVDVEPMPAEPEPPAEEPATEPSTGQDTRAVDQTERDQVEGPEGQE